MKKICTSLISVCTVLFFLIFQINHKVLGQELDITPFFSHESGFYQEGFYLEITPKPETNIYYTLDSKTPTESSEQYISPLWIDETYIEADGSMIEINESSLINYPISMIVTSDTNWNSPKEDIFTSTVIKVIAINKITNDKSEVITHTYFVSPNMFEKYTFPIMSLSTDPIHLYDYNQGIHIAGSSYDETIDNEEKSNRTGNYFQKGDKWEREVFVQLFETSGILVMSQHAGIRIHGGLSRKYPIKSYRLYARKEYDEQNTFHYQFFPDKEVDEFKRLILRNGGQSYQYTFMGEAFAQSLLKPLDLDIQYSTPIILFINGEYFGIRNIRDRFDTDYLKTHYGIDENRATILTGHAYMEDGSKLGQIHYQRLYNVATTGNLDSNKRYKKVERMLDINNFIDYMISEIYMGNVDWPQNNILYWRKNTSYKPTAPYGHDGRWRFMVNDLDASFGISWGTVMPSENSFERLTGENWKTGKLFVNLLENKQFKAHFIYRMLELLDTVFESEHVNQELEKMIDLYSPEMGEHISRFGYPSSYQAWLSYVDRMRNFALYRKDYLIPYLEAYLNLDLKHKLEIDFQDSMGSITINQLSYKQIDDVQYYHDLPITLNAIPNEGYHLEGWYYQDQLLSNDQTFIIEPEQALNIEARFHEGVLDNQIQEEKNLVGLVISIIITAINVTILVIKVKKKS